MSELSSLEDIERLYAARGGLTYGEGVTQIEHALQCAALAEADGAAPSLVVAALLHDVGHLFVREEDVVQFKYDDLHQVAGARALSGLFGEAVCEPIALHVAAKRYLCFAEAGYVEALSKASQGSLRLQGGPFDAAEAAVFEQRPYWREAVALRRYDDTGKREEASGRAFADFAPMMRGLLVGGPV
jgi:phosphonate degradation associated HDIG domain protein